MERRLTLGSLFDGSGGFPLAGVMNGIEPRWLAEIEPYPCRVTAARFPSVPNHGDVTKINGAEIEPVDIITFGSPCQNLSLAGRREGLYGDRSSLFFEAIRIIKEMRNATANEFPRFAVWENVPGAFSSNGGRDFQTVLQAFCEVCKGGDVPKPADKWKHAGCIVGDGFSVAWRLYDAQFWGVPQRRKRIYLIADFGSECAGEILFERESMPGLDQQGGQAREGNAEDAPRGSGGSREAGCLNPWERQAARLFGVGGTFHTLYAGERSGLQRDGVVYCLQGNVIDRAATCNGCGWHDGISYTLNTIDRPAVAYYTMQSMGEYAEKGVAASLEARQYKSATDLVIHSTDQDIGFFQSTGRGWWAKSEKAGTLRTPCGGDSSKANLVVYDITHPDSVFREYVNVTPTLAARMGTGGNQVPIRIDTGKPPRKYIVRRLTPLECCRLQGFPDWWEDGVEGSDTARYKMWGNAIALPCAFDVLGRIAKRMQKEATYWNVKPTDEQRGLTPWEEN